MISDADHASDFPPEPHLHVWGVATRVVLGRVFWSVNQGGLLL